MQKAEYKVKGGKLIRIKLTAKGKTIENIKITGDFFLHPEDLIDELEKTLKGHSLNEEELSNLIQAFLRIRGATLLGASPEDFARCIMMAGGNSG